MIEIIFILAAIAVTLVITGLAHKWTRELFNRKLRYVPAAQTGKAPIIAGVAATLIALPLVPILPLFSMATAVCLGVAVGMGAAAGVRDVKGRLGGF